MKRPALWILVFMVCGIYLRLGISEMVCLASFLFIVILTSYFVIYKKRRVYSVLLLFALGGFLLADYGVGITRSFEKGMDQVTVEGVVQEEKETASQNRKYIVKGDVYLSNGTKIENQRISITMTEGEVFSLGDIIKGEGELLPLETAHVPGGYDERMDLMAKDISYKMFPAKMEKIGKEFSLFTAIGQRKEALFSALDQVLPAEEGGVVKALVTGERGDISDETRELYTKAGITHILAISGLHVSMLALGVFLFLEQGLRLKKGTAVGGTMLFSVTFLIFTGFSPSALRAVLMLLLILLGKLVLRRADMFNSIAIAALLILAWQPLYLWNAGFQLSFVTMIGIGVALIPMKKWKPTRKKWLGGLWISLYASLFSFPLVAYHFYSISLSGIFVNLFIIPFCGILLGFCFLTSVLALCVPAAAVFSAGSVFAILRYYEGVCQMAAAIPGSYLLVGRPSVAAIVLYYLLLLCITFYGKRFCRKRSIGALTIALGLVVFGNRFLWKENTVAFLDVGQGDAIVVSTHDKRAFLIDGGGHFGKELGRNTGSTVVKPYLDYLGIARLDGVVITHFDNDHMTGALEILEQVPVDAVYVSSYPFENRAGWQRLKEVVEKQGLLLYTMKQNDKGIWAKNGVWECLYPPEGIRYTDGDDNHGSLVMKYTYGDTRILCMADATIEDEGWMLAQNVNLGADIVKLGHHGAAGSSGDKFLDAAKPQEAVVSSGKDNQYGHPHEETLGRLEQRGINLYSTDRMQTVLVQISLTRGYEITPLSERKAVYERIKETMEKP